MSSSPTDIAKWAALLLVAAGCKLGGGDSARTPAAEPMRVAVVNGEEVSERVPPQLKSDPAQYRAFVEQIIYRKAVLQRAARQGVELTAAERAAVVATLPSRAATKEYLRTQGITYEAYIKDAYDVGLIQKMERRDVFDSMTIDPGEIKHAYAADSKGLSGPRHFITAMALLGGCGETAAAARLASALGTAALPSQGHRLDTAKLSRAAGLDASHLWSLDLHLDGAGRPAAVIGYDRSRDALAPPIGPALVDAIAAWVKAARPGDVWAPKCIDGSLWLAQQVGAADARRLRLDEVGDELEAPLLAQRQKQAFNHYVDAVLAETRASIIAVANPRERP